MRSASRVLACVVALIACDDGAEDPAAADAMPTDAPADAVAVDAGPSDAGADDAAPTPWPCRQGWSTAPDGVSCQPDPVEVDAWPCVGVWFRSETGCAPPQDPACGLHRFGYPGGCSEAWPCPPDWAPVAGLGCAPGPDECPRGTRPTWAGECDALGHDEATCERAFDPPEGAVVLEAGVHRMERLADVTVVGVCAAQVTLRVETLGPGVTLRGVTVLADEAAPVVEAGANVTLREVRVEGEHAGLVVEAGAQVEAEAFAVVGPGGGVTVAGAAALSCVRCLVEDTVQAAFYARGELTLRDTTARVSVRDGILADTGATLRVEDLRVVGAVHAVTVSGAQGHAERVVVEGGADGVQVTHRGELTLEDYAALATAGTVLAVRNARGVVRRVTADAEPTPRGVRHNGVSVLGATSELDLEQAVFHDAGTRGVEVNEGTARVRDLYVRGGLFGLDVSWHGLLEATGVRIVEPELSPVLASNADLRLSSAWLGPAQGAPDPVLVSVLASDDTGERPARVTLVDTEIALPELPAVGVVALQGSQVEARRLRVTSEGDELERSALFVSGVGRIAVEGGHIRAPRVAGSASGGAVVELRDVAVDQRPWVFDAVDVVGGAGLLLERVRILGGGGPLAVAQGEGTELRMRRVHVTGSSNVAVLDGAMATLEDVRLERPVGTAVAVFGTGATMVAERLRLEDGVPAFGVGRFVGIFVGDGAAASLEDTVVERVQGVGVYVRLAALEVAGLAVRVATRFGLDPGEGVRVEQSRVSGVDVTVSSVAGPGLVVADAEVELERAALLDNEVGVLRQGENAVRLSPSRVAGNAVDDDVCDQCSTTPPEVAPPKPVPPL